MGKVTCLLSGTPGFLIQNYTSSPEQWEALKDFRWRRDTISSVSERLLYPKCGEGIR